jgi:dTDP-4-amino-4,6-dideoxygalactose transaminase
MIALSEPILGGEEKRAVCEVIDSNWLSMGERVDAFEKAFAKAHGAEAAAAVNSCTAGLHLVLVALGLGPGDEILVPSLTFVATVNAIQYTGATPVFVEIQGLELPHISIDDAKKKCSERTKAVIVMHYGGYIVDCASWREFADEHNLFLIEDAAHACGMGRGARCSDASVFSFFANKNMTTAEGGMVLAGDQLILKRIRQLRSHGMTSNTLDRHQGHAFSYDVTMLGYNYRLDELRASLGIAQLKHLPNWITRRAELTNYYRDCLSELMPAVVIPFDRGHETTAHLMPILLPEKSDRLAIMRELRGEGIQTSVHYPPVHRFSLYSERFSGQKLPKTEEFCERELTLPLHPVLRKRDVKKVVGVLRKSIG